ncbi:MAG TPA: ATP-binding protein [Candidatus Saccharimonadales bacterium]|nr:ATP-binding protein [Candidatus Saccharimonadales bacterium]
MPDSDKQQTDPVLQHKVYDHLRLTRNIRWIIITLVLVSYPLLPGQSLADVAVLAVIAVLYNAALHIPTLAKQKWLTNKPTVLALDNLFIFLLIILSTGGLQGPYTSLLVFPIISAAFWYGAAVASIIGLSQLLAGTVIAYTSDKFVPLNSVKDFTIKVAAFTAVGLYVAMLTRTDRRERLDFAEKDFQINKERQQLLALINNIPDAVLIVDQTGQIGLFNQVTTHLIDSVSDLVGKPLSEVLHLVDESGQPVDLLAIASDTPKRRRDLKLAQKDGSEFALEADVSPYIVNQQSHGYIITLRDITKQRTLEEEQEEFISVASHELRTPIAIAEANLSTTLASPNAPSDPTVHHMIEQAHSNIGFISNIVDDLTTLSRAEQDQLEVDVDPLSPKEMLQELSDTFLTQAHIKHLELHVEVEDGLRPIISSRYRIKQVLQNFLINALKYTQEGSITLSVKNAERDQDGIIFSVKDTGIGIAETDKKNIFKKFFRSEDYRTRESGGSGLGLYISRKLADRLNAKIWFESELKKGSAFYLQVPPYSRRKEDHGKVVKAESQNLFESV